LRLALCLLLAFSLYDFSCTSSRGPLENHVLFQIQHIHPTYIVYATYEYYIYGGPSSRQTVKATDRNGGIKDPKKRRKRQRKEEKGCIFSKRKIIITARNPSKKVIIQTLNHGVNVTKAQIMLHSRSSLKR